MRIICMAQQKITLTFNSLELDNFLRRQSDNVGTAAIPCLSWIAANYSFSGLFGVDNVEIFSDNPKK